MDDYKKSAYQAAKDVTTTFSSSFSLASRFFDRETRQHIYNIYGLVRIADEVVDTYQGDDREIILDQLEDEVYKALERSYSANIIVYAFILTAQKHNIGKDLIHPFFKSMRTDLTQKSFTAKSYKDYIYGSAEVVGLMCLKVFVDESAYQKLYPGASALGAAFQKINFLRDIRDDYEERGRYYFPLDTYETFSDGTKEAIIKDIKSDLKLAKAAVPHLPKSAKKAVTVALRYYEELLVKLDVATAEYIKSERLRVPNYRKLLIASGEIVKR